MEEEKEYRIYLRFDHEKITEYSDATVCIFAPSWVEKVVAAIGDELCQYTSSFDIYNCEGHKLGDFPINKECFGLKELVAISRNEAINVSGHIKLEYYGAIPADLVYAIKDLVRHCVIVGRDQGTHVGGYPRSFKRKPKSQPVYICDLSGLQFQQEINSGRLVLIGGDLPQGKYDNEIFKATVGEKKKSLAEVELFLKDNKADRYVNIAQDANSSIYLDLVAYRKFVAQDVVLSGVGINKLAQQHKEKILFKFRSYGTGFFAGDLGGKIDSDKLKAQLKEHIQEAVMQGLSVLFKDKDNSKWIHKIGLPFGKDKKKPESLTVGWRKIKILYDNNAPLDGARFFKVATTNCADPHVVMGNEMNHGSTDASVAENIQSKGNKFSPILNKEMKGEYVVIDTNSDQLVQANRSFFTKVGNKKSSKKIGIATNSKSYSF